MARGRTRLKDVAKATKVSVATVSMALSNHPKVSAVTRRRVLSACRDLGYRLKRDTARPTALRRCGLMVVGSDVRHAVNYPLLFHLSELSQHRRMRMEFASTPADLTGAELAQRVLSFGEGLDGLLLMGLVDHDLLAQVRRSGLPHVVAGHVIEPEKSASGYLPCTVVTYNDLGMGRYATRFLFDAGHRRVAFVCEILPRGLVHWRWLQGYRQAHLEADIPLDPARVVVTGKPEAGLGPAAEALLALPKDQRPTAYVVPDSRLAASLAAAMRWRGSDVPPEAMVFAAVEDLVRGLGLTRYPRLLGRSDELIRHCLMHLDRLTREPDSSPVEVAVGFDVINPLNQTRM